MRATETPAKNIIAANARAGRGRASKAKSSATRPAKDCSRTAVREAIRCHTPAWKRAGAAASTFQVLSF